MTEGRSLDGRRKAEVQGKTEVKMDQRKLKEIREAIDAGRYALSCLDQAMADLASASNFGLADLFGFDFLGGVGKHMKYRDARNSLEAAQMALSRFQNELADVNSVMNMNIEMGTFWTLADFFFDGFLADFIVQTKISEARDKVHQASYEVQRMLDNLVRLEIEEMNR